MATQIVHVEGLAEALGLGFSFRDWLDDNAAELTTEHAAASYGQAILLRDGHAYGPGDLPGVTIYLGTTEASGAGLIEPARAAGWRVRVHDV